LRAQASISAAVADVVFAGTGKTAAQLYQAATEGVAGSFALPGTIVLAGRTHVEPLDSRNVVARLAPCTSRQRDGCEAVNALEHIVYTAHLDHVGIGAPVDGDAIYNGALDNALGVSIMLEAARTLAASDMPAGRPMLFVALTAEEKGLLGAEWFATHP